MKISSMVLDFFTRKKTARHIATGHIFAIYPYEQAKTYI